MDYHAVHGYDVASFDTSEPHRLPTVDASQALEELENGEADYYIPTGVAGLDAALVGIGHVAGTSGGIKRGQITEIWGPPGSGKTAFGVQLAVSALCQQNGAVWIDCFQELQKDRLANILRHEQSARSMTSGIGTFTHYSCLTLPHFMALISRPASTVFDASVSVVIISSVSALINSALPRSHEAKLTSKAGGFGSNPNVKRSQAIQAIMTSLLKLAATRNCAVAILSQCATKMQSDRSAGLVPIINATAWEQKIATRIALFRSWTWHKRKASSVFLAGLQKLDGRRIHDPLDDIWAFRISSTGISIVPYESTNPMEVTNLAPQKRKLAQTEFEVPDSEDEDYGWAEEDSAALPPPPPQWQGSEDIILGYGIGHSSDEAEEEEDYETDSNSQEGEDRDSNDEQASIGNE